MKIETGKTYVTSTGLKLEILCNDLSGNWPIIATYLEDGNKKFVRYSIGGGISMSLVPEYFGSILREAGKYDDFKLGDKVMVRERNNDTWMKRYFIGVDGAGRAKTFSSGMDNWTSNDKSSFSAWSQCRKPTEEEDSYQTFY